MIQVKQNYQLYPLNFSACSKISLMHQFHSLCSSLLLRYCWNGIIRNNISAGEKGAGYIFAQRRIHAKHRIASPILNAKGRKRRNVKWIRWYGTKISSLRFIFRAPLNTSNKFYIEINYRKQPPYIYDRICGWLIADLRSCLSDVNIDNIFLELLIILLSIDW